MRAYYSRSCEEKIKIRFLPVSSTTLRKSIEEFVILGAAPRSAHLSNLITDRVLPTEPPPPSPPATFYQFHGSEEISKPGRNWWRELVTRRSWKISERFEARDDAWTSRKSCLPALTRLPLRVICYEIAIDRPFPFL